MLKSKGPSFNVGDVVRINNNSEDFSPLILSFLERHQLFLSTEFTIEKITATSEVERELAYRYYVSCGGEKFEDFYFFSNELTQESSAPCFWD